MTTSSTIDFSNGWPSYYALCILSYRLSTTYIYENSRITSLNKSSNSQVNCYKLERVKKEWQKLENLHFNLHILPTVLNVTCLLCQIMLLYHKFLNFNFTHYSDFVQYGKYWQKHQLNLRNSFITIFNYYRWKGIAVVGGDGTFYEVLNGIFARPDWQDVFKQVPLSVIPSGSGNGLVRWVFLCVHYTQYSLYKEFLWVTTKEFCNRGRGLSAAI